MTTENLQNKIDNIITKLFFWAIPKKLTPNHFTYIRLTLLPFIYYLLNNNYIIWGFFAFVIAACTDFIDGTLARKRNQVTDLGKTLDPIADKLLIGLMLYFVGFEYLIVKIFLVFITLEIIAVLSSGFMSRYFGRPIGANVFGKIKMVLQSFAVGFFLVGLMLNIEIIVLFSEWILIVALIFAILAGVEQTRLRLSRKIKKRQNVKDLANRRGLSEK